MARDNSWTFTVPLIVPIKLPIQETLSTTGCGLNDKSFHEAASEPKFFNFENARDSIERTELAKHFLQLHLPAARP